MALEFQSLSLKSGQPVPKSSNLHQIPTNIARIILHRISASSPKSGNSSWIPTNLASTIRTGKNPAVLAKCVGIRPLLPDSGCIVPDSDETDRNFVDRRRNLASAAGFLPQSLEFCHRLFFFVCNFFIQVKYPNTENYF